MLFDVLSHLLVSRRDEVDRRNRGSWVGLLPLAFLLLFLFATLLLALLLFFLLQPLLLFLFLGLPLLFGLLSLFLLPLLLLLVFFRLLAFGLLRFDYGRGGGRLKGF